MHGDVTDRGFPWDELMLAVIAIAILATPFVLAFRRFLEKQDMVHCQSNLKQIYLALNRYIQDNGGVFPEANCDSGASGNNWYQVLVLKGYLADKEVFVCPCDPSPETYNTGPATIGRRKTPYRGIDATCYYYDARTSTYRPGDGKAHVDDLFPAGGSYGLNRELGGHTRQEVMSPGKTPLLMGSVHPSFEDGTQAAAVSGAPTIMPRDGPFAGPHNARWHGGANMPYAKEGVDADARSEKRLKGGNNVAFLDGHVEFVSGARLGNRSPKCDTDVTKRADGEPFETDPTAPNCGEDVD